MTLDPNEFIVVPAVYVLDEFDMTDDEGNVVARIDQKFLEKLVARMREREATTGDLCPFVIGHTKDDPQGDEEANGPPLVGYLMNWQVLPFFDTGKLAAAADIWIYKKDVERVKKFPRRSSEVWVTKYEIDPVSALGATTPARDLGLMKLNRNGSFVYTRLQTGCLFECPVRLGKSEPSTLPTNRESQDMADEKKDGENKKPKADEGQSGAAKTNDGKMDMILSAIQANTEMMKQLMSAMNGGGDAGAKGAATAEGEDGEGGDGEGMSDDELEQMLMAAEQDGGGGGGEEKKAAPKGEEEDMDGEDDKSRNGEKPVKNSRTDQLADELAVVKSKLARTEIKDRLRLAVNRDGAAIDVDDEKLVTSLEILPPDVREDMIVRLSRHKSLTSTRGHAEGAIRNSRPADGKKRVTTKEDQQKVAKLARQKNIGYELAAQELGFEIG